MTDAGPRIFRTLEKTDGRDSFDAIVRAAATTFAASRRPTERQAQEFARLVLPLFDRTTAETRGMLATALASCPVLARELVERLLCEPAAIAAPFIAGSPLLTALDLARLAKRRDAATRQALKARVEPASAAPKRRRAKAAPAEAPSPPDVQNEAHPSPTGRTAGAKAEPATATDKPRRARPSPARQTALLSKGSPDLPARATSPSPATPDMPATADEAREVLRRLATAGRREPMPLTAQQPKPEPDLLTLALARDALGFRALLSAKLLLDAEQTALIETDASGRELAAALKALDTNKADAMTMLMMLKPAVGSDVAAFETLERIFETLDIAACRMRFPIGPGAFGDAPHRPLYAETRAPIRPEARSAVFGRRTAIPSETTRKRRS